MSESPSVDPTEAAGIARELSAVADEVAAMYVQLTEELAALGEPWGADAAGQAFAKRYVPKTRRTLAAGQALVDNMRALSAEIASAEGEFVNQDQTNAAAIAPGTDEQSPSQPPNDATTGGAAAGEVVP